MPNVCNSNYRLIDASEPDSWYNIAGERVPVIQYLPNGKIVTAGEPKHVQDYLAMLRGKEARGEEIIGPWLQ